LFPYIGNSIIPTDELIFFRGVGIPPTSYGKSRRLNNGNKDEWPWIFFWEDGKVLGFTLRCPEKRWGWNMSIYMEVSSWENTYKLCIFPLPCLIAGG